MTWIRYADNDNFLTLNTAKELHALSAIIFRFNYILLKYFHNFESMSQ